MASGLLSSDQMQALEDSLDSSEFTDSPTNKCLTQNEADQRDSAIRDGLRSLPTSVLNEYLQQENDAANDSIDQVIDIALNGPDSALSNIIDAALNGDPDCDDQINTVAAVIKKAKETESFKSVRAGIFSRVQKSFLDDMIEWNLFEPFDSPGILGQILGNTGAKR